MYTQIVVLLVVCGTIHVDEATTITRQAARLKCHSCSGVTNPHHCSKTIQCAADEECHAEGIIGDDGSVFYNSGCQKTKICQLVAQGKRSELQVCEACCGTDLCNLDLCQQSNDTSTLGAQCYECDDVASPLDCHTRVTCSHGEQCIVQEYVSKQMEIRYRLGCETKDRCDLIQKYTSVVRRTTQICNECCHSPGCNRHLCYNEDNFTRPAPSSACTDLPDIDCAQADQDLDICESRAPAATKFCPKFCGYCSANGATTPAPAPHLGSTVDPCRDSSEVDCQDMDANLHLCSQPSAPPTLLYCPRYCGLCGATTAPAVTTPTLTGTTQDPCFDDPGVDCQDMNNTLNICGKPNSPPTKLYCPKFCKLCTPSSPTGPQTTPNVAPLGTTTDPCHDDPGVDCQDMNNTLNICGKPNSPPTKLYCPKFCKLCTPSSPMGPQTTPNVAPLGTTTDPCHDSPDVNCKEMDDNLNICSKPSPPTRLYCSKYCKLC